MADSRARGGGRGAAIGVVLVLVGGALGALLGGARRAPDEGGPPCAAPRAAPWPAASAEELGLPGPEGLGVDDSWGAVGP